MKHIYSYLFLPFLFFLFACSDTEENQIDPYLTVCSKIMYSMYLLKEKREL